MISTLAFVVIILLAEVAVVWLAFLMGQTSRVGRE